MNISLSSNILVITVFTSCITVLKIDIKNLAIESYNRKRVIVEKVVKFKYSV